MSEYEIPWWEKWLKADMLKRLKMVEKLSFVNNVLEIAKVDDIPLKYKKHIIVTSLNSFFEDLEDAMRTKNQIESENK